MSEKRKKSFYWIMFAVIIVLAIVLKIYQNHFPSANVELKGQELNVLIARTIYQQQKGLGDRESLDPYDGMVFIYSESKRPTMVMRDMEFSIDIVWFLDGEVVDIAPNLPLEPNVPEKQLTRYYPRKLANLVLELPAGWAQRNNLKIGDRIRLVEDQT